MYSITDVIQKPTGASFAYTCTLLGLLDGYVHILLVISTVHMTLYIYMYVQLKRVSILKKYDEEIEGAKKSSFALGQLVNWLWYMCIIHVD